ncbi:MAG: hypothetical protein KGV44_07380 [Flavobacteriaceae bacterium]|nr:hypothetical protein [Flavobacteriaceae bacterium]
MIIKLIKNGERTEISKLFMNNYKPNKEEKASINKLYKENIEPASHIKRESWQSSIIWSIILMKIQNIEMIQRLDETRNLERIIFDILSLKLDKIVNYNFKNHKQIVHRTLEGRQEYFEIFLKALKKYKPKLINSEEKIIAKIDKLKEEKPKQKEDDYDILEIIFKELF